jgi:hypothetical protein
MPPHIESRPVTDDELVGRLCQPSEPEPAPAVLRLGGSDGACPTMTRASWPGAGLPRSRWPTSGCRGCHRASSTCRWSISLAASMFWLSSRQPVSDLVSSADREAGRPRCWWAHDNRIGAVMSTVGSGIVTQGIDYRHGSLLDILSRPTNSWTWRGCGTAVPAECDHRRAARPCRPPPARPAPARVPARAE